MCADCVAGCTDHGCETEPEAACDMDRPDCGGGQVAVVRDGCWVCVDLDTCEPPRCAPGEMRFYTCPDGSQVPWCVCMEDGTWECMLSPETQCRDVSCDDGTEVLCDSPPPICDEQFEILAVQNDCWVCVNPATCLPWGLPGCESDWDCRASEYCNPCGSSSCPGCLDCLPACTPHGCPTQDESQLICNMPRPDCGQGKVAVIRGGCWLCVGLDACAPDCEPGSEEPFICPDGTPVPWCFCDEIGTWACITSPELGCRDASCDDGTEALCDMIPPVCDEYEILAVQDYCWVCVNPDTCHPWGEPGCESDYDCAPEEYCDPCGTSSCPICEDCVPACAPHGCPTEQDLMCWCARPDCDPDGVAVIDDGCWICVYLQTCEPTGEGC